MEKYLVQKGSTLIKITNSLDAARRKAKVENAQIYKRENKKWVDIEERLFLDPKGRTKIR